MKDKILNISCDLFLRLGFKSVTMDEIAAESGVSKKTIYAHFSNKTELVEAVTSNLFETICVGIDDINEKETNPIVQLFTIKNFIMEHLKDEKSSPQYQLQKYYPKIFNSLRKKQFDVMQNSIRRNLEKGISMDLYRKNLDIDFISRIYFFGMTTLKDKEIFPLKNNSMTNLMNYYLEYHLRGICTDKGIKELEKQLNN